MKKFTLIFALVIGALGFARAGAYKIDEQKLMQTFENSHEVSFDEMYASDITALENTLIAKGDSKSRGGFLIRCFFCGGFALHRYYMDCTRGARMWALYFCVPIVGGVTACVDFFWVVFSDDALGKYEGSDKYIVWLD